VVRALSRGHDGVHIHVQARDLAARVLGGVTEEPRGGGVAVGGAARTVGRVGRGTVRVVACVRMAVFVRQRSCD